MPQKPVNRAFIKEAGTYEKLPMQCITDMYKPSNRLNRHIRSVKKMYFRVSLSGGLDG
jgi:hypothetical protein